MKKQHRIPTDHHNIIGGQMVDPQKVKDQLKRILKSKSFQNSEKLKKFLTYIIIEDVEGRSHTIKSYSIGTEALGQPSDFDVTNDGIIRTTANRLRTALEKYYQTEGKNDPIVISVPRGRYIPEYSENPNALISSSNDTEATSPSEDSPSTKSQNRGTRWLWVYTATAVFLVVAIGYGVQIIRSLNSPRFLSWYPPVIMIQTTNALTEDEQAVFFARNLPIRLSNAMISYDINYIVRTQDFSQAQNYANRLPNNQSAYVITSEVETNSTGLVVYWQLIDARTGIVLWSSHIQKESNDRIIDIIVHELTSENAVIRSAERRKLPLDPIPSYVCVTHSLNEMNIMTNAERDWMSKCLNATVIAQPNYAQAWALLALVHVENAIAAANAGDTKTSKTMLENGWRSFYNAEKLAPASWLTLRAKIALEFQTGDFIHFRSTASNALKRLPENARERIFIGERFFALGEYNEAITIIANTIAAMTMPRPTDYFFLAVDHYRHDKNHDALKLLQNHPVPESNFYWSLLAIVATKLNDTALAKAALRSLETIGSTQINNLETNLRNRHFRNEFIKKIHTDLSQVTAR